MRILEWVGPIAMICLWLFLLAFAVGTIFARSVPILITVWAFMLVIGTGVLVWSVIRMTLDEVGE